MKTVVVSRLLALAMVVLALITGCGSTSEPTTGLNPEPLVSILISQDPLSASMVAEVEQVERFITQDRIGNQRLYWREARQSGISPETLRLVSRILRLNAQIVQSARRGQQYQLSDRDLQELTPLFHQLGRSSTAGCGRFRDPSPCPPRPDSLLFFPSEAAVRDHLVSLGYHQTAPYAGGGSGRDFTLEIEVDTCGCCAFRSQAIYRQTSTQSWTYNTQSPEPNPEVLDYRWPTWYWGVYVLWWHQVFC